MASLEFNGCVSVTGDSPRLFGIVRAPLFGTSRLRGPRAPSANPSPTVDAAQLEDTLLNAQGSSLWEDTAKEFRERWSRPRATDATPHSRLSAGEGWLAVGHAAAAYDPIASQGLANSLSSAWLDAHALRDSFRGDAMALDICAAAVHLTWCRTQVAHDLIYRPA